MTEVTAQLRYLRTSPRKVRSLSRSLNGISLVRAEAVLSVLPKRAAQPLLALLRSAAANAKNNFKLSSEHLFIKEIRVDEGSALKRLFPRARGRADMKKKRASHITLVLTDEHKGNPKSQIPNPK